ncbi:MAG: hypothetical protein Q9168_005062 [Polycauliona sp. 1 TL-2023]
MAPSEETRAAHELIAPYLSEAGRETLQVLHKNPREPLNGDWGCNVDKLRLHSEEVGQKIKDIRNFQYLLEQRRQASLQAGFVWNDNGFANGVECQCDA